MQCPSAAISDITIESGYSVHQKCKLLPAPRNNSMRHELQCASHPFHLSDNEWTAALPPSFVTPRKAVAYRHNIQTENILAHQKGFLSSLFHSQIIGERRVRVACYGDTFFFLFFPGPEMMPHLPLLSGGPLRKPH